MKLAENNNTVESTFGAGHRLGIAATATAMRVLSKSLYSNPVHAVLREYACNAADAHTSIGCGDKPIEVHLPTYQNQNLKIRDYGPGIPPEKVIPIFATYFVSTKTEDNTQIGALGLGSKSAFAVADQMMVEIWHGGYYYCWNFYKDEKGFPTILEGKPTIVEPTTEPTGVLITIPVSDVYEYEYAAQEIYRYFNPIPLVFKGKTRVNIIRPAIITKFRTFYFESGNGTYVLMGNILYPVDAKIKGLENYADLGSNNQAVIPVNIGEVDFAASRESLEYNKKTIETLKDKWQEIVEDYSVTLQQQINEQKTPFLAVAHYNTIVLPAMLKAALYKKLIFKDKLLSSYYQSCSATNYNESLQFDPKKPVKVFTKTGYHGRRKYSTCDSASINKSTKIYINDLKTDKGIVSRVNEAVGSNGYIISNGINIDKWLELNHFDKADLIPVSTLPRVASIYGYDNRSKGGVFSIKGGGLHKSFWEKVDKAPNFGYYFVKSGDKVVINNELFFLGDTWRALNTLQLVPTDHSIFGVSKLHLKNFKEWERIDDKIIAALKEKQPEVEYASINRDTELTKLTEYWPDGVFKDSLVRLKKNIQQIYSWHDIYNAFGIELKPDKSLKLDDKAILKEYPMLKLIVDSFDKPTKKEVQEYIKSINKKEENA